MKKAFIFFILICFSVPLFAQDDSFTISSALILNEGDTLSLINNSQGSFLINNIDNYNFNSSYKANLDSIIKLFNNNLSNLEIDKYFIDYKNDNLKTKAKNELINTLNNTLQSYSNTLSTTNLSKINNLQKEIDNFDSNYEMNTNNYNLTFNKLEYSKFISILLNNNDQSIINKILLENNCDALLLISFNNISDLLNLKIEYLDRNQRTIIYNKILKNKRLFDNQEDILKSALSFFNSDYKLVTINNLKDNTFIKEIIGESKNRLNSTSINEYNQIKLNNYDLNNLNIINDYLLLKKDNYFLQISNQFDSYITKFNVSNDNTTLNLELKDEVVPSINLISNIGALQYKINGLDIYNGSSINLKYQQIPFIIEASKEGYESINVQNNSNLDAIQFNLKPLWQSDNEIVNKAQNDFYSSLLSYIFISFTTLSINNINDAIGSSELEPLIDVFSTSLVTLSSINIVNKLISYIKLATN